LAAGEVPLDLGPDYQPSTDISDSASSGESEESSPQTTAQFLEGRSDPLSPSDEDSSGAGSSVVTVDQITLSGNGRNQIIDPALGLSVPTLNLTELSQITIEFDNASGISQDDLVPRGWMNGTYTFSNFQVNGNQATWTLSSPITKDQVLLTVLIASYQIRFNVLPSDLNRDGVVDSADYVVWRKNLGWEAETNPADGNQDGRVDQMDYDFWKSHFGETGASPVPGDYNGDGTVDAADYVIWRRNLGWEAETNTADANQDGVVDQDDYNLWRADFGTDFSNPHDFAPLGSVTIENGATHINSPNVTLSLNVLDDLTDPDNIQMAFSQDGSMTFSDFEPFSMEKQLTLTGNDGAKEIIVRFRDEMGNINEYSDEIIFDQTQPLYYDIPQTIFNPTPEAYDYFGWSVVSVGQNFVVGAFWDNTGATHTGAAYLFDGNPESPTFGNLLHTFLNPNPVNYSRFGEYIFVMGQNILIPSGGVVYLFDANPESPSFGNLLHTFSVEGGLGGGSIAVVGKNLMVGVSGKDQGSMTDVGIAYLFDADLSSPTFGQLLHTFTNPDPQAYDRFGENVVSIGNNVLFEINYQRVSGANFAGIVYLYDSDPESPTFGNLLHTFSNPEPNEYDYFGDVVVAKGMDILISGWRDKVGGVEDLGAVYLFDGDPESPTFGTLLKRFLNPFPGEPPGYKAFGVQVGVVGDNIVITAPNDQYGPPVGGAVYLFDGNRNSPTFGSLLHTFLSPAPNVGDDFGLSLVVIGKRILIGSLRDDTSALNAGAAYLFDADPASPTFGDLLQTFLNPSPEVNDYFSDFLERSTTLVRDNLVIGHDTSDDGGLNVGAAYFFRGFGVIINNGAEITNSADVIATLAAQDNITSQENLQVSFSQDGVNFSSYQPFSETKQITLQGGDGEKTVYVRFRDEAGNVSEFSDTIILQQSGGGSLSSASVEPLNQTAPSSKDVVPLRAPLNWQAMTLNHMTDQKKIETDSNLEPKPRKSHRFRERHTSHLKRK
jgi:hypothetical protein